MLKWTDHFVRRPDWKCDGSARERFPLNSPDKAELALFIDSAQCQVDEHENWDGENLQTSSGSAFL